MSPPKQNPPHGLLLGWEEPGKGKAGFQSPVWDDGGEGHLVTVAPTGAGKGVSCIIPALLTWRGPAIVIDPKGENYAVTASRRRAMGQRVHVLDPFGLTDCIQPASLNPFDMLGMPRTASVDDMRVLADAIIQQKALGKNQDPYWESRAGQLITDAIRYCARHLPHPMLRDVRMVVEDYDNMSGIDRNSGTLRVCHPATTVPFLTYGMASDRTRICITSTAVEHLAFVTDGAVAGSLFNSTIDLKRVERGDPLTVYMVLPPDKLASHGKLLRLWLVTLLNALSKRTCPPARPTLFLVDEAAQLGEMKQLVSAITLMRGYGVRVWSFWQDISQIRSTYPGTWEAILNNCSFHQYFGASTPMAARDLQAYLGDTCPRPVSSLKPNQLALYRPAAKGAVLRMPHYLTDTMFQGHYDPNPFHRQRQELSVVDDDFAYEVEEKKGGTILHFPAREAQDG
jgi:type IV secretion system protein VirD4